MTHEYTVMEKKGQEELVVGRQKRLTEKKDRVA